MCGLCSYLRCVLTSPSCQVRQRAARAQTNMQLPLQAACTRLPCCGQRIEGYKVIHPCLHMHSVVIVGAWSAEQGGGCYGQGNRLSQGARHKAAANAVTEGRVACVCFSHRTRSRSPVAFQIIERSSYVVAVTFTERGSHAVTNALRRAYTWWWAHLLRSWMCTVVLTGDQFLTTSRFAMLIPARMSSREWTVEERQGCVSACLSEYLNA